MEPHLAIYCLIWPHCLLRNAVKADFNAKYNCTVRNSHGEDSFIVTLERRGKEAKVGGRYKER